MAFGKKETKKDKRNTVKNKKELLKKKTFKKETGKKGLSEKETEVKKAEAKKAEVKKSAARPAVKKGLSGKPTADIKAAGANILRKSKSPEKKTTGKTGPEKQKSIEKARRRDFSRKRSREGRNLRRKVLIRKFLQRKLP